MENNIVLGTDGRYIGHPYGQYAFIEMPKYTWEAVICNYHYPVVTPPNRFHRFMQRLCFGIVWRKL